MELTFITMHDISAKCVILYASDSITDVLGYAPYEVTNKSTFDYFHSDDLPLALDRYKNEIELEHASSLAYVRVHSKAGEWLTCECVFSCVYDVLIAATTIYRPGPRSQGKALAAPVVQHAFRNSCPEVRYEMIAHLSAKFTSIVPAKGREPRAALILNRFTKKLTILYATHALTELVGLGPPGAVGTSFLDCIDPDCVDGAVDAIDRAKQNDSVAYMRFRWRHPHERSTSGMSVDTSSPESERPDVFNTGKYHTGPTDVEAVVSCTSDGIIIVLRVASANRPLLPSRGLFAVPWSAVPLYPAPPYPNSQSQIGHSEVQQDVVGNVVLDSLQEISVIVWGLHIQHDILTRHAAGTPHGLATPDGLDDHGVPRSEILPQFSIDGTSVPTAIEIESD